MCPHEISYLIIFLNVEGGSWYKVIELWRRISHEWFGTIPLYHPHNHEWPLVRPGHWKVYVTSLLSVFSSCYVRQLTLSLPCMKIERFLRTPWSGSHCAFCTPCRVMSQLNLFFKINHTESGKWGWEHCYKATRECGRSFGTRYWAEVGRVWRPQKKTDRRENFWSVLGTG